MKTTKGSLPVILMASSIALLLVLQFFWLRSTYRDAEETFRNETNLIFRNTVFALHDSLLQRTIEPIPGDSSFQWAARRRFHLNVSPDFPSPEIHNDSSLSFINITRDRAEIEVRMSGHYKSDSIQTILRPVIQRIQGDRSPKRFILRIGADSLASDSIRLYYKDALNKAGIDAHFDVVTLKNYSPRRIERKLKHSRDTFISEFVRIGPFNNYAVSFSGIDTLLLREIAPQILFSVFLTALTIGSFFILFRALRSQQRLMQIKNDFISNVTHELKTPVATVSVALEALKNFHALDNPQKTTEYLEIAQSELNRLTLMTDKILKTAVFEDKGVELKPETFNLDALIQQVLSSMKLVFEKRKNRLRYQKEGTDFTLAASLTHVTNVLYNLIDNALKYSGDEASIDVWLKEASEYVTFSIRDNGIGIPAEYQKKIFEKFFRVPTGDVHTVKGYGLGLSYVASVVKSHGGIITVESMPGEGSCFIVTLPKRYAH